MAHQADQAWYVTTCYLLSCTRMEAVGVWQLYQHTMQHIIMDRHRRNCQRHTRNSMYSVCMTGPPNQHTPCGAIDRYVSAQKPPKDCPSMLHLPSCVVLLRGTKLLRTCSASATMLSALQQEVRMQDSLQLTGLMLHSNSLGPASRLACANPLPFNAHVDSSPTRMQHVIVLPCLCGCQC